MTLKGNLIAGARSFPGNPYDGRTLHEQIEQSAMLMQGFGVKPEVVYADLGYRGVDKDNPSVEIKHGGKDKWLIMKSSDCLNVAKRSSRSSGSSMRITTWTAVTSNLQRVMRSHGWLLHPLVVRLIALKSLGLLLCLLQVRGLMGLVEKLAEIIGLIRLQMGGYLRFASRFAILKKRFTELLSCDSVPYV